MRLDSDLGLLEYIDFCEASDRRDADLMYELCELRWTGAYADVRRRQLWWGQDGFHFRCWFVEIPQLVRPAQSDGLNITYFA